MQIDFVTDRKVTQPADKSRELLQYVFIGDLLVHRVWVVSCFPHRVCPSNPVSSFPGRLLNASYLGKGSLARHIPIILADELAYLRQYLFSGGRHIFQEYIRKNSLWREDNSVHGSV